MKLSLYFLTLLILLVSCNQEKKENEKSPAKLTEEEAVFFPVTDFLKGQLIEIRERGLAPIFYQDKKGKMDSTWIKMDSMESFVADFLSPSIDSFSMAEYYTLKKFYDQTLGRITLTYEANKVLPKNNPWLSWNVYIDPEKGTVEKIYLVKSASPNQKLLLNWSCKTQCSMTGIEEDEKTNTTNVFRKETIKWKY